MANNLKRHHRAGASRSGSTTSAANCSTAGDLARLIDEDGISGVTSNPTIFEKAIGGSERYDAALRGSSHERARRARDLLRRSRSRTSATAPTCCAPIFDATRRADGYISFELPPDLADDADGSSRPRTRSASGSARRTC